MFICDGGFQLTERFLTPYRQKSITNNQRKIFNYRISRSRRIVEQAFGILANRFRVLLGTMNVASETAQRNVCAICILHNMLIDRNSTSYLNENLEDLDLDNDFNDLNSNENDNANAIRDNFSTYFFLRDIISNQWNVLPDES